MIQLTDLKHCKRRIKMSDADFGVLYEYCKKRKRCKHPRVYGGTCDVCFEILYHESESEGGWQQRASRSYVSKHDRVKHFGKIVLKSKQWENESQLVSAFEDFSWGWDRIDKGGRKNSLLNKWILWKLCEAGGIHCEKYKIKNVRSENEHERLWAAVCDENDLKKKDCVYVNEPDCKNI